MKTIEVVAAIIHHDNKYFATKRGYGEFKGGWEFPGGKIVLKEHEASKWLSKENLRTVEWLPADIGVVDVLTK